MDLRKSDNVQTTQVKTPVHPVFSAANRQRHLETAAHYSRLTSRQSPQILLFS